MIVLSSTISDTHRNVPLKRQHEQCLGHESWAGQDSKSARLLLILFSPSLTHTHVHTHTFLFIIFSALIRFCASDIVMDRENNKDHTISVRRFFECSPLTGS